jgi:hypothetical protein
MKAFSSLKDFCYMAHRHPAHGYETRSNKILEYKCKYVQLCLFYIQTLPNLSNSCGPEGPAQVEFCGRQNSVHMWSNTVELGYNVMKGTGYFVSL